MPVLPDLETLRPVGPDLDTLRPVETGPDLATLRPFSDGGEDFGFSAIQSAARRPEEPSPTPSSDVVPRSHEERAARNFYNEFAATGNLPISKSVDLSGPLVTIPRVTAKIVADAMDVITAPYKPGVPMSETIADLPKREPSTAEQIVSGAVNAINSTTESLTTPENLAILPLAAEAKLAKPVSAYFYAQMLKALPEAAQRAGTASVTGTPEEKAEAYVSLGVHMGMAAMAGSHAAVPATPKAVGLTKAIDRSDLAPLTDKAAPPIVREAGPPRPGDEFKSELPNVSPDLQTLAPATAAVVGDLENPAKPEDLDAIRPVEPAKPITPDAKPEPEPANPADIRANPTSPDLGRNEPLPAETPTGPEAVLPVGPEAKGTGGAYEGETSEQSFRQKADALALKLEGLKSGVRPGGPQTHAFGLLADLWDRGVSVAQAVIRAGGSVADAIDAFINHVKSESKEVFDEQGARRHLFDILSGYSDEPATYGIAQRVTEKRTRQGQIGVVPPGDGISASDSVDLGRELLASGADPQKVITDFAQNKSVSSEGMATVRAHGEKLAQAANKAADEFGIESEQYKAAAKADDEWTRAIKPLQTEWHKIGQAQQGETDIDTGTFHGLRREYVSATDKDFTETQKTDAVRISKGVQTGKEAADSAKQELNKELAKRTPQEDAEKRAFDAAKKTVRENAIRLAKAEQDKLAADRARQTAAEKTLSASELAAKNAAEKTVRENAIRKARAQEQEASKAADLAKKALEEAQKASEAAREAVRKFHRDNATARAKQAADELNDPAKKAWRLAQEYIDKGTDNFDEIRNKIATEMGLPVEKVTKLLTESPRVKHLADEVWRKQQQYRRLDSQARQWLRNQETPLYRRALASVPKIMFGLKVGFHGTVALGTHAPMVAFQPRFWKAYVRDFGKMYKMIGNTAYYEMQVQDLLRRKNYITARRAGLVNDPFTFEDFNSPNTAKYFGNLSGMGNRGYSILKILRQDMFDQHWERLPKYGQNQAMAEAISDAVNHATGVVKGSAPKASNVILFAPRLEASRVMWLAGDPLRAADTFLTWKKATDAEKYFAVNQMKEKAWVAGTMLGLLALNQGFLSATGSDQEVNFTDPFHSDWLKFKAAGMNFSYGNAMLTMARLPVRLYKIRSSDGGKLKNLIYPDEDTYSVLGEYTRSQLSPFASLTANLWLKGDWQNRPLPNSDRDVPKRLKKQGIAPYTWPEFWTEQVLPIPAEEAAREVWRHGLGMDEDQIKSALKALATIAVMGATGARLTEDIR